MVSSEKKKETSPFAPSPRLGAKASTYICRFVDPARDNLKFGIDFEGMEPENGALRTHRVLSAVTSSGLPSNLRGILPYGDRLALFSVNAQGRLTLGTLKDGSYVSGFSTDYQVPLSIEKEDYAASFLRTEDTSPHIEEQGSGRKLLFFPENKFGFAEGNNPPSSVLPLPDEMPELERAALLGGRLYGVKGQKLYISGSGGCFDWQFDSGRGESNPQNAWQGRITALTDRQMPVTALVPFKGSVYIFRENVLQKVVGNENPFSVKDLYRVGTGFGSSVCELEGKLYFIDGERLLSFDGSGVAELPPIPEGALPTGKAAVYGGKYYFGAEHLTTHYLFSYDPQTNCYGRLQTANAVVDLASNDGLYILLEPSSGVRSLMKLSGSRSLQSFSLDLPLLLRASPGKSELREDARSPMSPMPKRLCALSADLRLGVDSLLNAVVTLRGDGGNQTTVDLYAVSGQNGDRIVRWEGFLPVCSGGTLTLSGRGDVTVRSVELLFRAVGGRRA